MAYQGYAVTGDPRYRRRNQVAEVNARLQYLPQMLKEQQAKQQWDKEYGLEQDKYALAQRQAEWDRKYGKQTLQQARQAQEQAERQHRGAMGIQAAGLGLNFVDRGKPLFTQAAKFDPSADAKMLNTQISGVPAGGTGGSLFTTAGKNFLGALTPANTLGAGLLGFGAGAALGGGDKLKGALYGAGAGLLGNLLGGGGSSGVYDDIAGAISGGIGGLFSGLF